MEIFVMFAAAYAVLVGSSFGLQWVLGKAFKKPKFASVTSLDRCLTHGVVASGWTGIIAWLAISDRNQAVLVGSVALASVIGLIRANRKSPAPVLLGALPAASSSPTEFRNYDERGRYATRPMHLLPPKERTEWHERLRRMLARL